jgi:hypothetical protein
MALIAENHPALQSDSADFWKEELSNSKILLYEINKAIDFLTKNKYQKYTMDTGQNNMTVQYADLPTLLEKRLALLKSIQELEEILGIGPEGLNNSAFVVRPI